MQRPESYHHGNLRQALLAAAEELLAVCAELGDPHEQLRALGMVYVGYALDHPAAFRLMFRPEMGSPFGSEPIATPVFGILLHVVWACRAGAGSNPSDTERVAFAAWSLVHGLAALLLDGPLAALAGDRGQVHALVMTSTAHFLVNQ